MLVFLGGESEISPHTFLTPFSPTATITYHGLAVSMSEVPFQALSLFMPHKCQNVLPGLLPLISADIS